MKKDLKYSFLEAKDKIEAYCAYQERCHYEVNEKLFSWGIDEEDRNALMANLIENNFLNEERFVYTFISGKVNIKKWGKRKIKFGLKAKKIPEPIISKALSDVDDEVYMSNLESLAKKKWKEKTGSFYQKKAKVSNYLYQRGYEGELISEVLKGITENED